MLKINDRAHIALAVIVILAAVSACGKDSADPVDLAVSPFASYRDIPGVTAEEIAAIEDLRKKYSAFNYGMTLSTEAFLTNGGDRAIGGYSTLLCQWLGGLFGIPFKPAIYGRNELLSAFEGGEIDFTGDMTITEERRQNRFMTGTIAERLLKAYKIEGTPPIADIAKSRPPRLVFTEGFAPFDDIINVADFDFEPVFADNHDDAYRVIKSGEADAYLTMNIAEFAFDIYGDVVSETFYPLVFASAGLFTQKNDLVPIISVVQKALENEGSAFLAELYYLGHHDYIRNRFLERLTPAEREYIQRNPVVKVATESGSYPLSFYNKNDKALQGIAFDVMSELKFITGLSFEVASPLHEGFLVLTDMVESGEASIITAMMRSRERERSFLLPETAIMKEYPILVSKSEFHNVQFSELSSVTVGLVRGTLHAELFKRWFPNNRLYREYDNLDGAFDALVRGEVDMFMCMSNYLLSLLNYKELAGYKANVVFDHSFDITFGVNKDEAVLYSIVDKAMRLIDMETIARYWTSKTYDYRVKVAEGRLPWLIGAAVLSLITLTLTLTMFYRGRNLRKQKEAEAKIGEADERAQLMLENTPLITMVWAEDLQILGCNQHAPRIFGLSTKDEYIEKFYQLFPEYQPNGEPSAQMAQKAISRAFSEGRSRIAEITMTHTVTGEDIPFDVTLFRIRYKDKDAVLSYGLDLRERNAAIAKMRESDECAQILFNVAPYACCMYNQEGNLIDCNEETMNMFGIPDKNSYFKRASELSPEYQPCGTLSSVKSDINGSLAFEKGFLRFEWMYKKNNGELFPSEVTLVLVNYKGERALAGYIRDLTEQKAREKLAKEVMEKTSTLMALFNSTTDMIFCKDINLCYTECNKAMENYLNIHNSDIVGKREMEALNIPPHIAEQLTATDKKVIIEGQTVSSVEQIKIFDGRMLPFEIVRSPLIQDGEVTGLVGMARDITERKAAEEELKRQHSLMDTVNAAAAVLLEPDTDGGLNSINRSMEMVCHNLDADRVYLWQRFRKDGGGTSYRQMYKWVSPEYAVDVNLPEFPFDEILPYWNSLFSARKSLNGPIDTFPEEERKFLSQYNAQSSLAVPLFFKEELWGFVSFDDCRKRRFFSKADEHTLSSWGLLVIGAIQRGKIMFDLEQAVEEAKRASSEAMKAYAEAETALEAKSRFIANMNHEMRTPMNVIVGLTDLMLEEEEVPGNVKETLNKINIAGTTLMGLISDVLDISKVEAGRMDLMPVQYHVASMLNDIIALNTIRAEDKPIVFKLDINEDIPANLFGDDLRVKQILNNLLSNAFKYTKEGSITLGVDCQWDGRPHDGFVWVSFYVSDTGMGIRKDDVAKLFTDYNQVDTRANRAIEGTGLGLSITKKFVDLMEGHISVESEYGKGTTFRVRIKQGFIAGKSIGKETVESLSGFRYSDEKKQEQKKLVRSDLSYARVLVVDDFPTNLDVAAGMLRKYQMRVDCVTSGQEALDLISAGKPVYDAVFMDHMMPGMDGVEATKEIRALGGEYSQNIPIIALTANAVAESEKMFLENGFNAFLPKPFNVMSLDSVVQRWVRKGEGKRDVKD